VTPAAVLLCFALVATMAAASLLQWWGHPRRQARRWMARTRARALTALEDGERARVHGVAHGPAAALTAPFTGRPCIAFRATVEQLGEGGRWDEILVREEGLPFELLASGVAARVEGPFVIGLETDASSEDQEEISPATLRTFRSFGPFPRRVLGQGLRLRFCEAALVHGQPVYVIGRASVSIDPQGWRESARSAPIKRVIRGPTVLATAPTSDAAARSLG
jgi:hypothetical protein